MAGFGDQRNLELLVEGGFTPVQAIQIATSNGAKLLGELDHSRGTIAAGKDSRSGGDRRQSGGANRGYPQGQSGVQGRRRLRPGQAHGIGARRGRDALILQRPCATVNIFVNRFTQISRYIVIGSMASCFSHTVGKVTGCHKAVMSGLIFCISLREKSMNLKSDYIAIAVVFRLRVRPIRRRRGWNFRNRARRVQRRGSERKVVISSASQGQVRSITSNAPAIFAAPALIPGHGISGDGHGRGIRDL